MVTPDAPSPESRKSPPRPHVDPKIEAAWREVLTNGHPGRWAFLPSDPRCLICQQPFHGLGGTLLRAFTGYRPSRMTPNMCNVCEDQMPPGGAEVDVAVLFADLRGSTTMGAAMGSGEYAALLNRFYEATSHVLIAAQSWIDKLVGDEIMALYIPGMGPDYRLRAVRAGVALLRAVGYERGEEPWLPVGVGIHAGTAFVGKVGAAGVQEVTALGDTSMSLPASRLRPRRESCSSARPSISQWRRPTRKSSGARSSCGARTKTSRCASCGRESCKRSRKHHLDMLMRLCYVQNR